MNTLRERLAVIGNCPDLFARQDRVLFFLQTFEHQSLVFPLHACRMLIALA